MGGDGTCPAGPAPVADAGTPEPSAGPVPSAGAPSRARGRFRANLEALRTLRELQQAGREAPPRSVRLWRCGEAGGAAGLSEFFDENRPAYIEDRVELRE